MRANVKFLTVIVLLVGAILFSNLRSQGLPVPVLKKLDLFPKKIGTLSGEVSYFSKEIYEKLGVDDSILINYRDSSQKSKSISFYVGYYESQKKGEMIHSPKNCMVGSGWEPTSIEEIPVNLESPRRIIQVTKMIIEKGMQKAVVLYWYQSGDRIIANEYVQRLYFIWDSIRYNKTNGSFIRITSPVIDNDIQGTIEFEKEFIRKITPLLKEHLPG